MVLAVPPGIVTHLVSMYSNTLDYTFYKITTFAENERCAVLHCGPAQKRKYKKK